LEWINSILPPVIGRDMILVNVDQLIDDIPRSARDLTVKELTQWYKFVRKNEVLK
jgi:hypothetical protein